MEYKVNIIAEMKLHLSVTLPHLFGYSALDNYHPEPSAAVACGTWHSASILTPLT